MTVINTQRLSDLSPDVIQALARIYGEWIAGLKPGDTWQAVEIGAYLVDGMQLLRFVVKKRTTTQIVCEVNNGVFSCEVRYYSKNGNKVGADHFCSLPSPSTPESIEKAKAVQKRKLGFPR